eukprot:6644079-Prymnesium_polylepis.1
MAAFQQLNRTDASHLVRWYGEWAGEEVNAPRRPLASMEILSHEFERVRPDDYEQLERDLEHEGCSQ